MRRVLRVVLLREVCILLARWNVEPLALPPLAHKSDALQAISRYATWWADASAQATRAPRVNGVARRHVQLFVSGMVHADELAQHYHGFMFVVAKC